MGNKPEDIDKALNPWMLMPKNAKETSLMGEVKDFIELYKPCAVCYMIALFLYLTLRVVVV